MKKITLKKIKHFVTWWFVYWRWELLYHLLYKILPIDNRLVCSISWKGKYFNCNPQAIASYLSQHKMLKLKIVAVVDYPQQYKLQFPDIKFVKTKSIGHLLAQLSCKIFIANVRMAEFEKKKGQYYIQTWHGMGPKKSEKDSSDTLSSDYINNAKYDCYQTDLMLSGSQWQTDWIKKSTWYKGKILEVGTPRDDCFFHTNVYLIMKNKVYSTYKINPSVKLVLFAPTFRSAGEIAQNSIDVDDLLNAFSRKFGEEYALLLRLHPNVAKQPLPEIYSKYLSSKVYNATLYPDMQDLLCAADVLVTDFSSVSTEFVMQDKPCFLYIPDYDTYDRGLYFKPNEMPFPYSYNNKDLIEKILNFNMDYYLENLSSYKMRIGMVEKGNACEKILDFLMKNLIVRPC